MIRIAALLLTASLLGCASMQPPAAAGVAAVLDDWHRAAAEANEPRYFAHLAPEAIFLGTDATERWTAESFRVWARPYFARGKAWTFVPRDRKIRFSRDGRVAWFDELLDSQSYGVCRGSGVLQKIGDDWRIEQYNLSIPIPNALANEFVERIRATGKSGN